MAAKAINLKKTLKTVKVRNFEARVKQSQDLPPWSNIEQDATWLTGLFFCWLNLFGPLNSAQVANPPAADWPHRDGAPAVMLAYVNAYDNKLDEIIPARVALYKKLLGGHLPSNGVPTRTKLEKVKGLATGLHQVVVYKATELTQSAFLKRSPVS